MSAPFPQSPRPAPERSGGPLGLKEISALVAAGAGLIGYLIGFFNEVASVAIGSLAGFSLLLAAALAGLRFVPKTPDGLFAAAPLAAYATLALLQDVVGGGSGGIGVVLLLLALAQLGAVVGVLLIDGGIIDAPSKPAQPAKPQFGQPGPFKQGGPGGPGRPGGPGASGGPSGPGGHGGPGGSGGPGGPSGPGGPGAWSPAGQPGQPAQPGHFGQPGGGWSPSSNPQPQQPGGWNPSSGGFPTPIQPGQSASPSGQPSGQPGPSSQPGQPSQSGQASGPQGTQQMPHPGANPPSF